MHVAIVDQGGAIIRSKAIATNPSRSVSEIIDDAFGVIGGLMKDSGVKLEEVESIGVGVPGAVDKSAGVVLHAHNLQWYNVPLAEEIRKHIDKPVFMENDANCAALAELIRGVFKGAKNALLLTLGTGLGSSILINGRMYGGRKGTGVEIGHITIHEGGLPCTCGNKGCFEVYCAASALEREGRRAVIDHPYGMLYNAVKGDYKAITAKHVMDCAKKGDSISLDIFNRYIETLGSAVASMINMFDPEIVAIGGGVSKNGEFLLVPLRENVRKKVFFKRLPTAIIEVTKMGSEAGVVGAAMLSQHHNIIDDYYAE